MGLDPISSVSDLAKLILGRVLPDKAAKDAANAELAKMEVSGELAQLSGQLDIDKAEAASGSVFVAGWRPAIGWTCAIALFLDFIVRPVAMWACSALGYKLDFPNLDMTELWPLMSGMLGMTAAHAWENVTTTSQKKR